MFRNAVSINEPLFCIDDFFFSPSYIQTEAFSRLHKFNRREQTKSNKSISGSMTIIWFMKNKWLYLGIATSRTKIWFQTSKMDWWFIRSIQWYTVTRSLYVLHIKWQTFLNSFKGSKTAVHFTGQHRQHDYINANEIRVYMAENDKNAHCMLFFNVGYSQS